VVRTAQVDLRRQVPAQLAAEGALDRDRLEGEFLPTGGHIAAAALTGDYKQSPLDDWKSEGHFLSIGEDEAKM
jgi:hypothetical protein